jgi:hypothetical protein
MVVVVAGTPVVVAEASAVVVDAAATVVVVTTVVEAGPVVGVGSVAGAVVGVADEHPAAATATSATPIDTRRAGPRPTERRAGRVSQFHLATGER